MREEGSGTRAMVEQALSERNLKVEPVLSLASTEAIKRSVAAALGVSIISSLAISLELNFGSLAVMPVKGLVIRRPLHLQMRHGKEVSPAMKEFLKILAIQVR